MFPNKYDLRPWASSASATERSPWPAAHSESTPVEQARPAYPHVGGSFIQIELGDALSPQANSQRDEVVDVDLDISQDGQALPFSIEASQVLATVSTEDFSSSTPQDSLEDQLHPPGGDSTPSATQPPHPPRDLSIIRVISTLSMENCCKLLIKRRFGSLNHQ